ncbi:MAG: hypothetical protein KDK64_07295 [Chlamydiia bacterium]|nr:hypothetical protein [Chlamydiia bacterium]
MKHRLKTLFSHIVRDDQLHAKWLNTLSYLENCGARKIAACEHPTLVKEEMLKHAAEEFRHSHYLKRQLIKVSASPFETYSRKSLLGSFTTLRYLDRLDLFTSKFLLREEKKGREEAKQLSYLLVTYAIECRAQELYPLYHDVLRTLGSKVYVKSIVLEEEQHLKEMERGLRTFPEGRRYANVICAYEHQLYHNWIESIFCGLQKGRQSSLFA